MGLCICIDQTHKHIVRQLSTSISLSAHLYCRNRRLVITVGFMTSAITALMMVVVVVKKKKGIFEAHRPLLSRISLQPAAIHFTLA